MAIKTYNKLVRDLIPDIIENSGKQCRTRILSDDEYLEKLDAKLDEELEEYTCKIDLDEDEYLRFSQNSVRSCPYYRYYDEYKSVQKQN